MKHLIYSILCLFLGYNLSAQKLDGYWLGQLNVQGQTMRIAFNISNQEGHYSTTMDSPDQKAKDIPAKTISMTKENIEVSIPQMGVNFTGELILKNKIKGIFKQGQFQIPLELEKVKHLASNLSRPQNPIKPYPYDSEDITFENKKSNISLSGTLTKPKQGGAFPCIILISGSGAQNRDEEILGHKPFLVLADHFTKLGFAVLRYDDRGTNQSEGDFHTATSLDFAEDVESALAFLKTRKDIDHHKIGLIGHSEGGLIAPMVATNHPTEISFIVLLAGTGVIGKEIILDQIEAINRSNGETESQISNSLYMSKVIFDYLESIQDNENRKDLLTKFIKDQINNNSKFKLPKDVTAKQFIKSQVPSLSSDWMNFFLFYNPQETLSKVTCPILAINGDKDQQVTSELNIPIIKKIIEQNQPNTNKAIILPNLNHLFQECKTGSPNEYENIKQTFSPLALQAISNWLKPFYL